jgi:hypothetical protein
VCALGAGFRAGGVALRRAHGPWPRTRANISSLDAAPRASVELLGYSPSFATLGRPDASSDEFRPHALTRTRPTRRLLTSPGWSTAVGKPYAFRTPAAVPVPS